MMYKVLFVCTANICRTPMAESYFNRLVAQERLEDCMDAESAGTWAMEGMPAAELSRQVCAENGLDISNHRSRPVELHLMKSADLVLCMAQEHKNDLLRVFPHFREKIFTLREFQTNSFMEFTSIMDPYGKSLEDYRETFAIIAREIRRIFPLLRQQAQMKRKIT